MTFLQMLQAAGIIIMALGTLTATAAYLFSRWRQRSAKTQLAYIQDLERRVTFLEKRNERLHRIAHKALLRATYAERLLFMRCPEFQLNPAGNGCAHCARGLAYGQSGYCFLPNGNMTSTLLGNDEDLEKDTAPDPDLEL